MVTDWVTVITSSCLLYDLPSDQIYRIGMIQTVLCEMYADQVVVLVREKC